MGATAAAVLRTRVLPRWYGIASLVAAGILLVGALTFAQDGFLAPDGGYTFLGYGIELLWTATTGVLLFRLANVETGDGTIRRAWTSTACERVNRSGQGCCGMAFEESATVRRGESEVSSGAPVG